jgi:hypothetical protein
MRRALKVPPRCRPALIRIAAITTLATILVVDFILGCGPSLTLRAYLARSFWEPMHYTAESLVPADRAKQGGTTPFAAFLSAAVPAPLEDLREAYRRLASPNGTAESGPVQKARRCAVQALAPGVLTGGNLEEAWLIDCKIDLRLAEKNPDALTAVRRKLEDFLAFSSSPAFASEARGWLARALYLQRDYTRAAKIYLDEIDSPESILGRETLVTSLRWVYSAGSRDLWDHLDEFFDSPRHALFLVNLVTNPDRSRWHRSAAVQPTMEESGRRILNLLHKHPALFQSGADSEALVMALMRTSFYLGDAAAALRYAKEIPGSGELDRNPEYNWMIASARVVLRDYARAEAPLLRMLRSPAGTGADRRTAAQALMGVYLKTGRPVKALWAAFLQASERSSQEEEERNFDSARLQWCDWCTALDLPYLLDAPLNDSDLREYLRVYPEPVGPPLSVFSWGHQQLYTAPQAVQYSLAVRLARHGEYEEAARIYAGLGAREREGRMKILASLSARTRDASLPASDRFAASYAYGSYMADNPDRLFFNDLFWRGFQREVFLESGSDKFGVGGPPSQPGFTRKERQAILKNDRRLRDEQEERWRAYQILKGVAEGSGDARLARRAALKIVDSLARINTDRFGRQQEVHTALSAWKRYLRAHQN